MLSDDEMMQRMQSGWRGGLSEGTICGQGSLLQNTAIIRSWLPDVCKRYEITSVCDAGAGDLHWIPRIDWDVDYKPFDLIPRSSEVGKIDITRRKLPNCDAILCRMVLNHLDDKRVDMAIKKFRKSGKYLIATHFIGGGVQRISQFMRLDLTEYLGEPIEMSKDGHEDNCRLALWEL